MENLNLEGHQNRIIASRVTATLLKKIIFFLFDKVVTLVGGGSVINEAYGLSCETFDVRRWIHVFCVIRHSILNLVFWGITFKRKK